MSSSQHLTTKTAGRRPIIDNVLVRCASPMLLRFLAAGWISAGVFSVWFVLNAEPRHAVTLKYIPFVPVLSYFGVAGPALCGWIALECLWRWLPTDAMALWILPGVGALVGYGLSAFVVGYDCDWNVQEGLEISGTVSAVLVSLVNHLCFRPLPSPTGTEALRVGRWTTLIIVGLVLLTLVSIPMTLASLAIHLGPRHAAAY